MSFDAVLVAAIILLCVLQLVVLIVVWFVHHSLSALRENDMRHLDETLKQLHRDVGDVTTSLREINRWIGEHLKLHIEIANALKDLDRGDR